MLKTGPMRAAALVALALCAPLLSCASPAERMRGGAESLAIGNVTVLTMTERDQRIENATVVVRDGVIQAVGPAGEVRVPAGSTRIDGRGKFLMPGLTDAHVHVQNTALISHFYGGGGQNIFPEGAYQTQDVLTPYVVNGVVQVLNLTSDANTMAQRDAVRRGEVLGPHIMMGVMVDGSPPLQPRGIQRVAATPEEGRQIVRDIAREGYDFVKTYGALDRATFEAIVDESRRNDIPVVGHLPAMGALPPEDVFRPGFGILAHVEEVAHATNNGSDADIARYVEAMRRNNSALLSTIVLVQRILDQTRDVNSLRNVPGFAYVSPTELPVWFQYNRYAPRSSPERIANLQGQVDFNRRFVRAAYAAGVPVLPGTDSLIAGLVPGFSLHEELAALSAAGIPNHVVLASATRIASERLGTSAERGTIEVGKRADLLLLDGDPVADIANTKTIAAVILGGRYLGRAQLDAMLADLSRRYAAMPPFNPPPPPPRGPPRQPGFDDHAGDVE